MTANTREKHCTSGNARAPANWHKNATQQHRVTDLKYGIATARALYSQQQTRNKTKRYKNTHKKKQTLTQDKRGKAGSTGENQAARATAYVAERQEVWRRWLARAFASIVKRGRRSSCAITADLKVHSHETRLF